MRRLAVLFALLLVAACSQADTDARGVGVRDAWARQTAEGQDTGGVYLTITNDGEEADRLVAASPPLASAIEVHEMDMSGGMMEMRPAESGIPIPARSATVLAPGAKYHLMLVEPKRVLEVGTVVPVTLQFERAQPVTVDAKVMPIGARGING